MKAASKLHTKRIKDLPPSLRPHEKLKNVTQENLTDAELIALLLGSGTAKDNAVRLAEHILKQVSLTSLSHISFKELTAIKGVGHMKAARILAALELGERIFISKSLTKQTILSSLDALRELAPIADKKQEYMIVLYLNARHELIQKETVAVGSLNTAFIEPKEILRPAILHPSASFILAHNHPSGDPTPSLEDIEFTKRIAEAGEIMGITLIDHVIICKEAYSSFRELKLM